MAKFLTIADVAEYLNVSVGQVRTLIKTGELPAIQVDRLNEYISRGYANTREKIESSRH